MYAHIMESAQRTGRYGRRVKDVAARTKVLKIINGSITGQGSDNRERTTTMTWRLTNKIRRIPVRWITSSNYAIPVMNMQLFRDGAANPSYRTTMNLLCEARAPEIGNEQVRGPVCSSEK